MRSIAPAPDSRAALRLLQLASPALPVGAYSYSEGLEYAVESGAIRDAAALRVWLEDALASGGARLEAAVLTRVFNARAGRDGQSVDRWNTWLTAARESEELRAQNLEMGRSLLKLLAELQPPLPDAERILARPCNFAVAFAVAAVHWGIARDAAVAAYLQTWVANLIGAGVKLIPLGQTAGQQLLWDMQASIDRAAREALAMEDEDLAVSNWGQALACMQHETQYSRLFRS